MDNFEELERMALNAAKEPDCAVSRDDIIRWQRLFSYSYEQAADLIERHISDYSRRRVSEEHWEMIRGHLESQGYDRNAYEHELAIGRKRPKSSTSPKVKLSTRQARATYIVKLSGLLSTPEDVRIAAGLATKPDRIQGEGEDGEASFCFIDGLAKKAITKWLTTQGISFIPTFARVVQKAQKELSSISIFPTLGVDSTLPQHRATDRGSIFEPTQEQYPVWYFFYGTLADNTILSRQLCLPEDEFLVLFPAFVLNAKLETWAGKYKAPVDEPYAASPIYGSAYRVTSKEHEDALQMYETENYEVVRCKISIDGEAVQGCTFRFIGTFD